MSKRTYFARVRISEASLWKTEPLLRRLDIELTERCNNNCIHCYINLPADDAKAREREMSTEEVKGVLNEAASLGCLAVRFTGGEPLLREDFEELYLFTRKLGIKVHLFTNATLINPHLLELFARIPPLREIEVSIYGMKKKSYEAVTRVPGSYEAAWRGVNMLLERQIPFIVKGTILPPTRSEAAEFEAWAATIPWMNNPPKYSMSLDLRGRRDSDKKNRLINGLRLSPEQELKVIMGRGDRYVEEMRQFCSKFTGSPGDELFHCGSGLGSGCVDAYGRFQPCMLLRHPDIICDLKKQSLKVALTKKVPKMRRIKAKNPEYLARCARCFLKGFCDQCPGKSWIEHGTLDSPVDYLCAIAHAKARYLGLLKVGEKAWEIEDWQERIDSFSSKEPDP
jgi:radical SAM protein with 4Fe4S-binding SPASM domain